MPSGLVEEFTDREFAGASYGAAFPIPAAPPAPGIVFGPPLQLEDPPWREQPQVAPPPSETSDPQELGNRALAELKASLGEDAYDPPAYGPPDQSWTPGAKAGVPAAPLARRGVAVKVAYGILCDELGHARDGGRAWATPSLEVRATQPGFIGVDQRLDAGEAQLLEPGGLGPRERLLELGQSVAPPERESLAETLRCERRVARGVRSFGFASQLLEPDDVDARRVDLDRVAGRPRPKHPAREHLAELRHVDLDHLVRRLGDLGAPEVVHEPVDRDRAVRVEEQPGEQRAQLSTADDDARRPVVDLERAEEPEVHRATLLRGRSDLTMTSK
jgi:hypothetical protein